jgi:murein L,D-transpeptidase YcbB/YkuD
MRFNNALFLAAICSVVAAAPEAASMPASMRARVESARSPELRWPDWSRYRTEVREFYRRTGGLAWVRDGAATPQARALAARMESAGLKGLDPLDYDGDRWNGRMAALATGPAQEAFDVAFTASLTRYASHLQIGRINPATLKQKVGAGAKRVPMTGLLVELASSPDPGARLDQIEPPYPGYRALLAQLPRYLELAGKPFTVFPAPRKVAPGRAYPGAGVLAERLTALGDLTAEEAKTLRPGWYDPALAEAVKSFQGRHGLQPDGLLGGKTLVQLNTPYTQRLEQIQLTLERWRWISLDPGKRLIWVNLPAFNLAALTPKEASYTWDLTCKVVVGEAFEHKTHVLTGEINTVVFRPFWNVPPSILKHDILPALRKNPKYLVRHDLEIVRWYEDPGPVVAQTPGAIRALAAGKLQLRQRPGPNNSLGLVKLLFPNNQDIYLHDTPARGRFANARRDDSHGCIRVEKPAELVAWVLQDDPAWTLEKVKAAMAADGPSVKVAVTAPVQVMIVYGTATVDGSGRVYFYNDVYGNDGLLKKALGACRLKDF